ncbi:helix-turn-helix domain-containing protein [Fontibacillus sp. BL9]|uniref:helix-turn-helix domain-containing protein n=1 Tax=Fontibacillus sp. BL9 TaxID=3389971 RepID=UPI00397BB6EB
MEFSEAHNIFLERHRTVRQGECLRRLKEGHGHAERLFLEAVWWPAFGQFQYLHPEYEVNDFKDGFRYLDFAYIRVSLQLAIEIDGFGPHWRNISRTQFSDHCRRQNDLITDGWKVLRFTYDDVRESPRYCQQKLQQFMGRWLGEERQVLEADWVEKEVIRLFMRAGGPLTPADLCSYMGVQSRKARRLLKSLMEKGWIQAASGTERVRSYRLNLEGKDFKL